MSSCSSLLGSYTQYKGIAIRIVDDRVVWSSTEAHEQYPLSNCPSQVIRVVLSTNIHRLLLECTSADWQVPRLGQSVLTRWRSLVTCNGKQADWHVCHRNWVQLEQLGRHEIMTRRLKCKHFDIVDDERLHFAKVHV